MLDSVRWGIGAVSLPVFFICLHSRLEHYSPSHFALFGSASYVRLKDTQSPSVETSHYVHFFVYYIYLGQLLSVLELVQI